MVESSHPVLANRKLGKGLKTCGKLVRNLDSSLDRSKKISWGKRLEIPVGNVKEYKN